MTRRSASSADRQHPAFEGDVHTVGCNTRHLRHDGDIVGCLIDVARRDKDRTRRPALIVVSYGWSALIDSSDFLCHIPLRRFKLNARLLAETAAIFVLLIRGVPDAALRREYRRRLVRAAWRRREPEVIQGYASKCAMHFRAHRMVQEMLSQPQLSSRAAA